MSIETISDTSGVSPIVVRYFGKLKESLEAKETPQQRLALLAGERQRWEARMSLATQTVCRSTKTAPGELSIYDYTVTVSHLKRLATEAAEAARADDKMRRALDMAWGEINAIGGTADVHDRYGAGINRAVEEALAIIERLGGRDPLLTQTKGN
jgi:hypothetical protein